MMKKLGGIFRRDGENLGEERTIIDDVEEKTNKMTTISDILGYKPIDIHSHFDHGVKGDAYGIRDAQRANMQLGPLEHSFLEHDSVGIEYGGYSTYSSVLITDRIKEENDYLSELVKITPRMRQWVVIHPERDETFRQAEELLKSPLTLGIKIHPVCHGYSILDHYEKIFSFADKHSAVVLMHPDRISDMPSACDGFPNMKLIIAHLGTEDHVNAVLLSRHGNIYVDASGGDSNMNNVIEYAVSRIGAEKILFGTDTYSAAFQTGRIAFSRINDEEKRLILRDNAVRLFPKVFA